ncbi:MAG: polysaccharide biosynthesis tyrosine autokinase, partial [Chitinophagaceae bacterium]
KNNEKIVPSFLGIDDPILVGFITEYNKAQLQYTSDANTYAAKSEILDRQKANLEEIKSAIIKRAKDYRNDLSETLAKLKSKDAELKSLFGTLPASKKTMKSIGRQGTIKEAIYVYLMQKREETMVTSASTTSNYQQIDSATTPKNPIEPQPSRIRLFGILAGLLIPVIFIYLRTLLNDKVTTREDISKKTKAPFVGEVGHYEDTKAFVVSQKSRSIISEQFRIIRTNLQFVLGNNKVVLVTSSISGEGKSFVSLNLGAVLAITGKKVAILEFDLRKPRIIKNIGLQRKDLGISNYLSGQTKKLDDLYFTMEEYPNMHIYGCGPIPPNPSELMLGEHMKTLFDSLKETYDFVIVDSAPVGLVSDTFTINQFADAVIYV